jgi:superfamily II DNA or RNA helicase
MRVEATRTLRDYQREGNEAIRAEHAAGRRRTAAVYATGLGKTDMIAELAWGEVDAGGRVLALCHRYELLDQITARLRVYRSDYGIGRIGKGRKVFGMPVDVGMTGTLSSSRGSVLGRLPDYSMVIYDECHHAAAKGNVRVLDKLGCMAGGSTKLAGFTATMYRAERRGWGTADVFDSIAIERGIHWGIEHGHLIRPYGVAIKADHLRLDKVKSNSTGDDYADGALGEMVLLDVEQVVEAVIRREKDDPRQTAMFWPTVQAAQVYADAFTAAGYPTRLVTGATPIGDGPDDRGSAERGTGIYGALATGKIWATSGVMVQTEGWDCPPVSRIVMGRPTKLPGLYQQIAGRMLRPLDPALYPGFPPKTDAEMVDIVGMVRGQTLATLTDLVHGVAYDASVIEDAPCERCGGFTKAALGRGADGVLCLCDAGKAPEKRGRAIKGPAEFEFVDLLGSEWLWLQTPENEIPVLAVGVRFAAIRENDDGSFRAAHLALRGPRSRDWIRRDATLLVERATLEQARMACEQWAASYERQSAGASWQPEYGRSASSWRKRGGPASAGQIDQAARVGVDVRGMNKRDASDAITLGQVAARGFR